MEISNSREKFFSNKRADNTHARMQVIVVGGKKKKKNSFDCQFRLAMFLLPSIAGNNQEFAEFPTILKGECGLDPVLPIIFILFIPTVNVNK